MKSPCSLRLSGTIAMPARRVARALDRDRRSLELDLAAVEPVGAEDRARHLGAAAAHQPGEPDDLAGPT